PRVHRIAVELVASCASRLDLDQIREFTRTYQQITPLKMGELWALPTMLRLSILESLAETVAHITGLERPNKEAAFSEILPVPERPAGEAIVGKLVFRLRQLAAQDWKTFFEDVSLVELLLRRDPAGVYALMDFETRNTYRRIIEDLAHETRNNEQD